MMFLSDAIPSVHLSLIPSNHCSFCFVETFSSQGCVVHHQMETFSTLQALCEGNPSVAGGFPSQRLVTRRFDVFFDLRLNKRLSKQSRHHWLVTPPRSLWLYHPKNEEINKFFLSSVRPDGASYENFFRVIGPLWGKSILHRWVPRKGPEMWTVMWCLTA